MFKTMVSRVVCVAFKRTNGYAGMLLTMMVLSVGFAGCVGAPEDGPGEARQASTSRSAREYEFRELNVPAGCATGDTCRFVPPSCIGSTGGTCNYTSFFGINNRGTMVGNFAGSVDPTWTKVWGFVYERGTFTRVAIGDSAWVTVMAINDRGVSVGEVMIGNTGRFNAFRRDADGRIEILPTPVSSLWQAAATDINNAGTVVGNFSDEVTGWPRGYIYERGTVTTFNVPGARYTYISAIDDRGRLVGTFFDASAERERGYLYDRGRLTVVELPNAVGTNLTDINNRGQIVGSSAVRDPLTGLFSSQRFIYDDRRFNVLDLAGVSSPVILGINDAGTLVGTSDGYSWGLVGTLTPSR